MTTDARGHTTWAGSEHPSRASLLAFGLSINDPINVANATARATKLTELATAGVTPSTSAPLFFFMADTGQLVQTTDGTTFAILVASTGPTAWVPALTASGGGVSLGSGSTATGVYSKTGEWVDAYFSIQFGTSGVTVGTGTYRISVPVTIHADLASVTDGTIPLGQVRLRDASTGTERIYEAITRSDDANTFELRAIDANDNSAVTNAAPWTWGISDRLRGVLHYRAA
ncbi:hypothetical protein OEB99_16485 [Actinotalea sp. M2MS4P-6]|uniref:hypothetical protein n=1 Tax=Actinotalea sp. M2MS4P-6 TaxID=2983762 RepID=UPI0021E40832|nr:hypothetical protein [Actinotalea sp. M2MS4P-6]MCV2395914.1 hypothetical protein [Actinotalea sp. M2MS4P-6]